MVQPKSLLIHINILININIYIYINIYIRFCSGSCLVNRWLSFEKPVVITWLTIGYCLVIHIRYMNSLIYIRHTKRSVEMTPLRSLFYCSFCFFCFSCFFFCFFLAPVFQHWNDIHDYQHYGNDTDNECRQCVDRWIYPL